MDKTVTFVQQQSDMAIKQADLSKQQITTNSEMREIKTQLIRINDTMDVILQQHRDALNNK
jgi:hypothetical protein